MKGTNGAVANSGAATVSVLLGNGTGSVGTKTDFTTGTNPTSVAIADVSGDDKPDLAVANANSNTVSVLLGNGTGGFGAKTDFTTGSSPYSVAVGDVSGDGKPDLAVANANSNTVSVLLGNGAGGFGAKTDFFVGTLPRSVAIGDLNRNGNPDLAVANTGANTVSVLLGNGAGGFGAHTEFATGASPVSVAIGDVSGDGNPDLAVANANSGTVSVLLGNGAGSFAARTDFPAGFGATNSVAIGDVNGDGRTDLAAASGVVSVLLGNGTGSFGAKTDLTAITNPRALALGDLSGDGKPDLAVANFGPTVSVLLALQTTRTSLTSSPSPCVLAAPITLTASVSILAPGSGTATGTVSFFDGTTLLGTSPVNGGIAGLALFAPDLGSRSLTAAYSGDGKSFGSISLPATQRVVATAAASLASIQDVRNDQGRQVRARFARSGFDYLGSGTPITGYQIYRRGTVALTQSSPATGFGARLETKAVVAPDHLLIAGWDYVLTVPATTDAIYETVVPTLADSNATGLHRAVLFVRSATASPGVYYDSQPDSGYSVDNLPPAPPALFTGTRVAGATHLHWGANDEPDLWYYAVYRGTSADFVPEPSNRIATRPDTGYADPGPAGGYYKLSAVDVNGNESGYTLLTPGQTTDGTDAVALSFALERVRPNPVLGSELQISLVLADTAPARLELLDVSGRRVASRNVGALGPGRHTVDLAGGRRIASGIYMVRLIQGANVRVRRVTLL